MKFYKDKHNNIIELSRPSTSRGFPKPSTFVEPAVLPRRTSEEIRKAEATILSWLDSSDSTDSSGKSVEIIDAALDLSSTSQYPDLLQDTLPSTATFAPDVNSTLNTVTPMKVVKSDESWIVQKKKGSAKKRPKISDPKVNLLGIRKATNITPAMTRARAAITRCLITKTGSPP